MVSVSVTGDVKFDHLAKVVSALFLHCKFLSFFCFKVNESLVVRYVENM